MDLDIITVGSLAFHSYVLSFIVIRLLQVVCHLFGPYFGWERKAVGSIPAKIEIPYFLD